MNIYTWSRRAAALVLGCATFAATTAVHAAETRYPQRPVSLLVGFAPGGATDLLARFYARQLSEKLGQPFVVENRAGAGGNIAVQAVSQAKPDGYTLVMGANYIAVNAALERNPYDWRKELTPISLIAYTPNLLVVPAASKLHSVQDLIEAAKKPDSRLTFGSAGVGSSIHMSGELFKVMAGVDMTHVPYRGVSPAEMDLVAGTIDLMFGSISTAVPLVKAGKLRALAVTSMERTASLPDVPTIDEAGLKGFDTAATYMIMGPAGLPEGVIAALSKAVAEIAAEPQTRRYVENLYATILEGGPDATREYLEEDYAKWRRVAEATGVKAE